MKDKTSGVVKVPAPNEMVEKLIEGAIPCIRAQFHSAVDNGDKVPENEFNEASDKASKRAKLWASYSYLICLHEDTYILVPLPTVKFAVVKK